MKFVQPHSVKGNNYAIDLLYVLDNTVYDWFIERNHNYPAKAMRHIMTYYSVIMYEVDRIINQQVRPFGKKVYINPIGLYVSHHRSDAPWIDELQPNRNRSNELDAMNVLHRVHDWVTQQAFLPPSDHVVTVTRRDLVTGEGIKQVEGLAWPQSICGRFSYSIVEDNGPSQTAWSIVHELMHSLGADHGGLRNHTACEFESALNRPPSEDESYEQYRQGTKYIRNYKASDCAIKHIEEHLKLDEHFVTCLQQTFADWRGSIRDHLSHDITHRPGVRINAHDQCKLMFNSSYKLCPDPFYKQHLCNRLFCYDESSESMHCQSKGAYQPALYGTHCDHQHSCNEYGQCEMDAKMTRTTVAHRKQHINKMVIPSSTIIEDCSMTQADASYCKTILLHRPSLCQLSKFKYYCCHACFEQDNVTFKPKRYAMQLLRN